jgi:hypothetical protein
MRAYEETAAPESDAFQPAPIAGWVLQSGLTTH